MNNEESKEDEDERQSRSVLLRIIDSPKTEQLAQQTKAKHGMCVGLRRKGLLCGAVGFFVVGSVYFSDRISIMMSVNKRSILDPGKKEEEDCDTKTNDCEPGLLCLHKPKPILSIPSWADLKQAAMPSVKPPGICKRDGSNVGKQSDLGDGKRCNNNEECVSEYCKQDGMPAGDNFKGTCKQKTEADAKVDKFNGGDVTIGTNRR